MSNSTPNETTPGGPPLPVAGRHCPTSGAFDRVILFVGSLAYLGFVPIASGTVAVAVVGIPLHLILRAWLGIGWPAYAVFVGVFTLLSIWIAGHADRVLNEEDSSKNVIDELPGYWIAVFGLPLTWQVVVTAFFLERAIDIAKVWPARWIERNLPGGWGVVLDDVVAGFYTLGLLHLGAYLVPQWLGIGP